MKQFLFILVVLVSGCIAAPEPGAVSPDAASEADMQGEERDIGPVSSDMVADEVDLENDTGEACQDCYELVVEAPSPPEVGQRQESCLVSEDRMLRGLAAWERSNGLRAVGGQCQGVELSIRDEQIHVLLGAPGEFQRIGNSQQISADGSRCQGDEWVVGVVIFETPEGPVQLQTMCSTIHFEPVDDSDSTYEFVAGEVTMATLSGGDCSANCTAREHACPSGTAAVGIRAEVASSPARPTESVITSFELVCSVVSLSRARR